jgi:predicted acetyltransferase
LLPEPHRDLEIEGFLCWMQRIVTIDTAMTVRGWPERAAGCVELEVTDPVTGVERVVLEVEAGSARVTRGGSGAVRCGIGALSAWYSSSLRAQDAVRLGLLEGDADAVTAMDGLIAGGLPWMPDFF